LQSRGPYVFYVIDAWGEVYTDIVVEERLAALELGL
jgi:hypothetical protein